LDVAETSSVPPAIEVFGRPDDSIDESEEIGETDIDNKAACTNVPESPVPSKRCDEKYDRKGCKDW
jgi:hypothetical protein